MFWVLALLDGRPCGLDRVFHRALGARFGAEAHHFSGESTAEIGAVAVQRDQIEGDDV